MKLMEEVDSMLDKISEFNLEQLNEIIQITRERKREIITRQVPELREEIVQAMRSSADSGINTASISVGGYNEDVITKILKEFNIRGKCHANWVQRNGYCGIGRWQINITWRI